MAVVLAGCGGRGLTPWDDLKTLQAENTDKALQIQQLQAENSRLKEQVQTLSGLDQQVRLEAVDTLARIQIGKYTGLYDKDKDGIAETLVVYVEPLDSAQDYVKAVGQCAVQVWNLDAPQQQAKLAEWAVTPNQLHKSWGGSVFAAYYRLAFPMAHLLSGTPHELTVKVAFTDYLTGKILTGQKTVPVK
ncbi:MAG: hypothetical protein L0Y36_09290 [Planctomycetales bacterium]|nr:hypothetical protein [Planctomycetales bacterium]